MGIGTELNMYCIILGRLLRPRTKCGTK